MSVDSKKKWILVAQIGASIVAGIVVVVLRLHGIRFLFNFVPTFVLAWIPMYAGTAALGVVSKASRNVWLVWTAGLVILVLTSAYAAVGETPSAVIPIH